MSAARRLGLFGALATLVACGPRFTIDPSLDTPDSEDSGGELDGSVSDTGGVDAADAGPAQYGDVTDAARWATFDLKGLDARLAGFAGGAFDGRYVYLIPNGGGAESVIARYDTTATLSDAGAWATFELAGLGGATVFAGVAFDGRFLYLVPSARSAPSGLAARYDTRAAFAASASWAVFDTTKVAAGAKGFIGGVYDGRYVYFVPSSNGLADGLAVRYDTTATFDQGSSWASFDVASLDARAAGFFGGGFDGRYLYLSPFNDGKAYDGLVARYDTQASFPSSSSWSTFDVAGVDARATGYWGNVFDGRYVYFVPRANDAGVHGLVARLDTRAAFGVASAWSTFDATRIAAGAAGFYGAAFDGRFVYFVPSGASGGSGLVTRFDSKAGFTTHASWSTFDLTQLDAGAHGYATAIFDGRFVYFVPHATGVIARFDARTPAALPPGFHGSFF